MASAKDDDLLSPYRAFLLDLTSKLLIDDLEKLKFACKDAVPYGKMEEVTTGFKFFDLLEQNGKISPQNLTPLENMMKAIRRADLALEVKQFMTDAGLKDDNPSNGPVVRQDEGDEVVPDGLTDDLEEKAVKTMCVAMDQPLGVGSTQNNPCSAGFSKNAPPASALRNGAGTGEPTNKGISPAPRVNRSFNGGLKDDMIAQGPTDSGGLKRSSLFLSSAQGPTDSGGLKRSSLFLSSAQGPTDSGGLKRSSLFLSSAQGPTDSGGLKRSSLFLSSAQSSRILTTNDPSWRARGTTLQGQSYQHFEPTDDPITADPSKKVVLVLRLVAREDEPDVMFPPDPCTPLSTLRPPPVPE